MTRAEIKEALIHYYEIDLKKNIKTIQNLLTNKQLNK